MEQNRAMGNEVTDRARVQDRFCFISFSFDKIPSKGA